MLDKFPLSVSTNIGWSKAFGDTTGVPPHRHVFTGGSDSVRGFRDGTLGPRDSLGNPYGGDAGIVGAVRSHHSAAGEIPDARRA